MAIQLHATDDAANGVHVYDDVGAFLFDYTSATVIPHPVKAVFASDETIWVSNATNTSPAFPLAHFSATGTLLGTGGITGIGGANGQFSGCVGVCISSDGSIFASDSGNNRIQKFNSSGSYVSKWGTFGTGDGQFDFSGTGYIACLDDEIYVSDFGNRRIQVFDTSGTFLRKWGTSGSGNGQFTGAYGIAFDASSQVYVVDAYVRRAQWFTTSGTYVGQYSPGFGSANGQFNFPLDITIDADGFIYIADYGNLRIQKFDSSFAYVTKWASNAPEGITATGSPPVPPEPVTAYQRIFGWRATIDYDNSIETVDLLVSPES